MFPDFTVPCIADRTMIILIGKFCTGMLPSHDDLDPGTLSHGVWSTGVPLAVSATWIEPSSNSTIPMRLA